MNKLLGGVVVFALLASPAARAEGQPSPGAYEVKEGSYAAKVAGVVTYAGKPPNDAPVKHAKDTAACGESAADDSLQVGPKGELANAVVILNVPAGKKAEPTKDAVLDQKGCQYFPRIQAVTVGSTLNILNSDSVLHTVHSYLGDASVFNKATPLKGDKRPVELKKPGLLQVKCDVHNWMQAYVWVSPSPYFAVTGKDGKFSIANVPAGEYSATVWHERLGSQEAKVKVGDKGEAKLDVKFAAK